MNKKLLIRIAIILGIFLIVIAPLTSGFISSFNRETDLRTRFNQKIDERTAFYDNMWKTISQKSDIAVKNDESFKENIQIIMDGRRDTTSFWKWVQETNPNANYHEVSILYQDLSRAVESKRDEFFMREKDLQSIKQQHDKLLMSFPTNLYLGILGKRNYLEYKPITSDRTDKVIETGKDNDVNVFN